ncbi:hypothetical protein OC835_005195 [Tilletia horrida]|nr:hypothetical protein OC835_005195 [Tilletia horrida]
MLRLTTYKTSTPMTATYCIVSADALQSFLASSRAADHVDPGAYSRLYGVINSAITASFLADPNLFATDASTTPQQSVYQPYVANESDAEPHLYTPSDYYAADAAAKVAATKAISSPHHHQGNKAISSPHHHQGNKANVEPPPTYNDAGTHRSTPCWLPSRYRIILPVVEVLQQRPEGIIYREFWKDLRTAARTEKNPRKKADLTAAIRLYQKPGKAAALLHDLSTFVDLHSRIIPIASTEEPYPAIFLTFPNTPFFDRPQFPKVWDQLGKALDW